MLYLSKIISGGQTGADQGGLEAGKILNLKTGGWIPKGFRTEDGPRPDLASYSLTEHNSFDYPPRTVANITESDATLVIGNEHELGTSLTIRMCGERGKPYLHIPYAPETEVTRGAVTTVKLWLERHHVRILNVAGNRESKNKGIQNFTRDLIVQAVKELPVAIAEEPVLGFFNEYRFLSNFWLLTELIEFENEFYPSVEHAFQAAKTLDAKDREIIRATHSPGKVKILGKKVVLRNDWEQIKVEIMKQLLFLKFREFGLRRKLLETGIRVLVETNYWHDNFWGSCACEKCANNGQNILGQLLMEVRSFYSVKL